MTNNTYTVQNGDTLYGISKQFNTSVQKLRELNDLSSDNIVESQILIISENDEDNPSECVYYTVEKGDNLYNIAKKYDTTVDSIKRYNNLATNNLKIGQRLKIPCHIDDEKKPTMPKYVNYTVKKGDSLYSIAKKFGTTVDKIKKDNDLYTTNLSVGMVLIIDDTKEISAVEECYGEEFDAPVEYTIYTVKKGDSLWTIAKKFNTTVKEIQQLNNLTSTSLSIDQELKIPNGETSSTEQKYIVQKGDSLWTIAKKFNTTTDSIKSKNNLKTNLISIGQELII